MPHSLSDIAARFDLILEGDDAPVDGIGTLQNATTTQITFLANPGYRCFLPQTQAAAVIVRETDAANCPTRSLISKDPYVAFARVATLFQPARGMPAGIHPSAVVDPTATLAAGIRVGPHAVIGAGCRIGAGCTIGPGSVIEPDSRLGQNCRLYANVSIGHGVRIGDRVIIHPGAVVGSDGFGIALAQDHWEKVPQIGSVVIGDDCEIGANTTIDRGAIEDTVLEDDVRVDNLVQIGHNVRIGAHTAIAAMSGICGSTRIGRYCLLGAGCGVQGHIRIADHVTIGAKSTAYYSIEEPGTIWSGLIPAQSLKEWQRNLSGLRRLDEMRRRLRRIEKSLESGNPEPNDE